MSPTDDSSRKRPEPQPTRALLLVALVVFIHPYTLARGEALPAAENDVKATSESAGERFGGEPRTRASKFDSRQSEIEKAARIRHDIDQVLSDPVIERVQEFLQRKSALVADALELGTTFLKHAQTATDRKSRSAISKRPRDSSWPSVTCPA